jgi:ribosomal protein S18 acetylase RimI-like enzyme
VFELYVSPSHQGLGFGTLLFDAARRKLAAHGHLSVLVWVLADNAPALDFYRARGGDMICESRESFGSESLKRLAFGFCKP